MTQSDDGIPSEVIQRLAELDAKAEDELTLCRDCGMDAWSFEEDGRLVHEEFYVDDALWDSAAPDDEVIRWTAPDGSRFGQGRFVLCIGCFERRLGRRLTRRDLLDEPAPDLGGNPPSGRLRDRWAGPG